jgi:hypothetical protein
LQDKEFVLSGIQNAYKDVKVMQSLPKAQEFLQKIVQVPSDAAVCADHQQNACICQDKGVLAGCMYLWNTNFSAVYKLTVEGQL